MFTNKIYIYIYALKDCAYVARHARLRLSTSCSRNDIDDPLYNYRSRPIQGAAS